MPPLRLRHLALGLVLGLLTAGQARAQPAPTLDQFICLRGATSRHVDRALRFTPRAAEEVRDRFNPAALKIDVRKPLGLCLPAGTALDPDTHLESYAARLTRTRPTQTKPAPENQRVTNRFGTDELDLKSIEGLLVPSVAAFDPPPGASGTVGPVDRFLCYGADRAQGLRGLPAAAAPLTLESAIGTLQYDVRAPVRLCLPADLNGTSPAAPGHPTALACYRAKLTRTRPPQPDALPRDVATTNLFGSEQLTLTAALELCVPSQASGVSASPTPARTTTPTPTPTVTPPPGFTLRVNPAAATVDIGTSAHFTATAVFENGDTQDFTERVLWQSSTAVALAPNVGGDRGRIDAVDVGSALISVLDEATGVTSTATGEDALLTVTGTLERIELLPVTVTRGKGESVRLRATGHFAGGFTRSIAERLVYASSAPGVAEPTNDAAPAEHSRVIALGEGTATLSATDPASGVSSTTSGDDVAMTVLPPLERCKILQTGPYTLAVDNAYQLTAHGFYAGGFERVVTQQVVWASDLPAVLAAPNADGDRSRVLALDPGEAHVTATDSVTGVACEGTVTFQVGVPEGLFLRYSSEWGSWRPIRAPKFRRIRAVQSFPPPIYYKYVTEKVIFETSNPTILKALNTPGDRGRLQGVGSGWATVTARDPVSGQVSQELYFRVLDGLTRVFARQNNSSRPRIVVVGQFIPIQAVGLFADYEGTLDPEDVTIVSDNPSVVTSTWMGTYWSVRAVAFGRATVSVIDNATGISSDAFGDSLPVAVRGALQRLEVFSNTAKARVGRPHAFGTMAFYAGDVSELVTTRVDYSSSNPAVAVATNDVYVRGLVEPVASGTAVIDAFDPVSGISSADSGGGATITVLGPLQRLMVTPTSETRSLGRSFSFTAIGRDAVGREINLTQEVDWSSSEPAVAVAPNEDGNRSRIDSKALGTTTISAFDPLESVSSSATGDDATFIVDGVLASLTLGAEKTQLVVGEPIQLTATGHLVSGATINLTQQVEYTSSDPAVAKADNPPGDRSRIEALKPGTAVISARDPGTGIVTAPGGTVTLTVTAP